MAGKSDLKGKIQSQNQVVSEKLSDMKKLFEQQKNDASRMIDEINRLLVSIDSKEGEMIRTIENIKEVE